MVVRSHSQLNSTKAGVSCITAGSHVASPDMAIMPVMANEPSFNRRIQLRRSTRNDTQLAKIGSKLLICKVQNTV